MTKKWVKTFFVLFLSFFERLTQFIRQRFYELLENNLKKPLENHLKVA